MVINEKFHLTMTYIYHKNKKIIIIIFNNLLEIKSDSKNSILFLVQVHWLKSHFMKHMNKAKSIHLSYRKIINFHVGPSN